MVLAAALQLDFCIAAVAYVGFSELDEFLGVLIELLEVVARVGYSSRFESWSISAA